MAEIFISPRHHSPRPRAKALRLPYLGDGPAPYFSSDTSRWKKSPQRSSFPMPLFSSLQFLPGDRLTASPGAAWMHLVTGDSNIELNEPTPSVSLLRPRPWRWFPALTSPHPPPPERNYCRLGDLLFWINIKLFSVWTRWQLLLPFWVGDYVFV